MISLMATDLDRINEALALTAAAGQGHEPAGSAHGGEFTSGPVGGGAPKKRGANQHTKAHERFRATHNEFLKMHQDANSLSPSDHAKVHESYLRGYERAKSPSTGPESPGHALSVRGNRVKTDAQMKAQFRAAEEHVIANSALGTDVNSMMTKAEAIGYHDGHRGVKLPPVMDSPLGRGPSSPNITTRSEAPPGSGKGFVNGERVGKNEIPAHLTKGSRVQVKGANGQIEHGTISRPPADANSRTVVHFDDGTYSDVAPHQVKPAGGATPKVHTSPGPGPGETRAEYNKRRYKSAGYLGMDTYGKNKFNDYLDSEWNKVHRKKR